MALNIPREDWPRFFDDLTKRRFEWKTDVEVMNREIGHQYLTTELPLKGITAEDHDGTTVIVVLVGTDKEHHQTHSIEDPAAVAFLPNKNDPGGIVEIEENDGTQTLIRVIEPMPIESGYGAFRTAGGG